CGSVHGGVFFISSLPSSWPGAMDVHDSYQPGDVWRGPQLLPKDGLHVSRALIISVHCFLSGRLTHLMKQSFLCAAQEAAPTAVACQLNLLHTRRARAPFSPGDSRSVPCCEED